MAGGYPYGVRKDEEKAEGLRSRVRQILGAQTPEKLLRSLSAEELAHVLAQTGADVLLRRQQERRKALGLQPTPFRSIAGAAQVGAACSVLRVSRERRFGHPKGLTNLGNTCYLSSVLQCLASSRPFFEELSRRKNLPKGLGPVGLETCEVLTKIREGEESQEKAVSAEKLLKLLVARYPQYGGRDQQDAHELLQSLLGTISDESSAAVVQGFLGHTCAAILCWGCQRISLKSEQFFDLSLELPGLGDRGADAGPLGVPAAALLEQDVAAAPEASPDSEAKEATSPEKEEPAPPAAPAWIEVELERPRGRRVAWGFEWGTKNGARLVTNIVPGSLADKWNLRQKSAGKEDEIVKAGYRLVSANDESVPDKVISILKDDFKVLFKLAPPGAEKEPEATAADAASGFVVELSRENVRTQWGARWDDGQMREGALVVVAVVEDSPLERWNLKCRASGRRQSVVCVGDKLLDANGATDVDDMREVMRNECKVRLRLEHANAVVASKANEAEADSGAKFEVVLVPRLEDATWGFRFDGAAREQGSFIVSNVATGSSLSMWNFQCLSKGEESLCAEAGDKLISAQHLEDALLAPHLRKEQSPEELEKVLNSAKGPATFVLVRSAARQATVRAMAERGDDSDEVQAQSKEALAQRLADRVRLLESAEECERALSPPLRTVFGAAYSQVQADKASESAARDLMHCLCGISAVEALEEDFQPIYQCGTCGKDGGAKRQYASKRAWFMPSLPKLLVVQLKRFRQRGSVWAKDKTHVETPCTLELPDLIFKQELVELFQPHLAKGSSPPSLSSAGKTRYELYGVCTHLGPSLHRGHYVSFVNIGPSLQEEEWYMFNDAEVVPCARADSLQVEAYLAFFRQVE